MQFKALFPARLEDWSRQVPPLQPLVSLTCLHWAPSAVSDMLEQCLTQSDIHLGAAIAQMIIGITRTDGRSEGEPLPPMQAGGQTFQLRQLEQR